MYAKKENGNQIKIRRPSYTPLKGVLGSSEARLSPGDAVQTAPFPALPVTTASSFSYHFACDSHLDTG